MGPRASLNGRKILPHWDSIPRWSSSKSVAIPTELPGSHYTECTQLISHLKLVPWPGNYKYTFSVFET